MSTTSLTITALQKDMTSDEAMQKLATLYNIPEERFKGLCRSLLTLKEPYVLLKQVDEATANAHLQKLTEIGFDCSISDESSGLSLVPIAKTAPAEIICPACDQPAGGGEICQNCAVIMHKYIKQKSFDNQFQSQSTAAISGVEKVEKLHEERSKKQKELNSVKKTKNSEDNKDTTPDSSNGHDEFSVNSNEKTSKLIYAAVTSVCLVIVGTGYVVHGLFNSSNISDSPVVASDAGFSATSDAGLEEFPIIASVDEIEQPESVQLTIFDKQLQRKQELEELGQQVKKLHEQNMMFTADGIVASKVDAGDRLFGEQEIIKLNGLQDDTANKLHHIHTLTTSMVSDVDRIDALLNLSSTYLHFELNEEAAKIHDEAAKIAFNITDSAEERILAEVIMAEHRLDGSVMNTAQQRYQIAKDKAVEIGLHELADSAFHYIALSEVTQGLTVDANATKDMIVDAETRDSLQVEIDKILAESQASKTPEHAAAHEQLKTGDSQLDELIEMTEQNKKVMDSASQLFKSVNVPGK